jgi:hypothetical protein
MKWKKIGRIIKPQKGLSWAQTHAMLPIPLHIEDNFYRIYFCGRDKSNRSLVGYAVIDIENPKNLIEYSEKPVFDLGNLGCFDDNGVSPSSIVRYKNELYLYYIGWKPRSTTRMGLMPGLAISRDEGLSFRRYSRAPILHLTDNEPISILTAPCVLYENNEFKMWYVSGIEWIHSDLPKYNIKYAESKDGKTWKQTNIVCIDNNSQEETSLARPWVIKEDGIYKMWFSYKRPPATYRCGYAESDDGKIWHRKDDEAGIGISDKGWDSEMVEYFSVFNHKGKKYMLYNGNEYGTTGAGLAILTEN